MPLVRHLALPEKYPLLVTMLTLQQVIHQVDEFTVAPILCSSLVSNRPLA